MDPVRSQCTDAQIERVLNAMEEIRLLDDKMPAQVTSCLLYIASHKDCHKQALEFALGISVAGASRCTDWLSKYHRLGKPGLDLISKSQDPTNRRRVMLSLTPKGVRFVERLRSILYD